MTRVSTTITTVDNKVLILPNNAIWGEVITDVTGSIERRVDLVLGIGYDDDMNKVESILRKAVAVHSRVLKKPEAVIRVHELADSSVNFISRPRVKAEYCWDVYWDLTGEVKKRFDAKRISLPFPQRDVHLVREPGA